MSTLLVFRAKPNPTGKDKTPTGTPKPEQLLGEWVDIKNTGSESVRISSLRLYHATFYNNCQPTGREELYWVGGGDGLLRPNQVIRVHTGRSRDAAYMNPLDRGQVDHHAFAEKNNFVLNNRCGDKITIKWQDSQGNWHADSASYAPNPPEGAILTRVGNYLVA